MGEGGRKVPVIFCQAKNQGSKHSIVAFKTKDHCWKAVKAPISEHWPSAECGGGGAAAGVFLQMLLQCVWQ